MNTEQRQTILDVHGYYYEQSDFASTKHRWYKNSVMIAAGANYAMVTRMAYQHYLDAQKEAQSNQAEATASETLQAPSPKFAVDDKVRYINAKYADDEYDTVISVGRDLSGYRYIVRYADNEESTIDFAERALEAYEEQSALVDIPDTLAEYRKREELLEARIAKLEADLAATGQIIIDAGNKVEKHSRINLKLTEENAQLKKENERMKQSLEYIVVIENQPAHTLVGYMRASALSGLGLPATQKQAEQLRESLLYKTSVESPVSTDGVTHIPCKTCQDKLVIWQWNADKGFAHICPDCPDDYSIEQLESRKYKNVSKFYQYNCNVCKGEGKTWEKFLHGGAGEIVCRKCNGKGKIVEEQASLTETELVHNHMIDKAIAAKQVLAQS